MSRRTMLMLAALGGLALGPALTASAQDASAGDKQQAQSPVEQGKAIAMDRRKGNCTACHQVPGVEFHGDIAPPLVAMKERFPDRDRLRTQIYDATELNPTSVMPPFGKHRILSEDEIDKVLEWVMTL